MNSLNLSEKVIYASQAAVPLDSNLMTGGGTDAASALNSILAEAPRLGSLELVIDGPALVGVPLEVYSNTMIRFLPGAGLFCHTGLNGPAIRNAHWVSSYNQGSPLYDGSTIVDQNITICGPGKIVGNRADGTTGNCTGGSPRFSAANAGGTPVGCFISPIMLFGVKNLTLRDFTVYDPPAFGVWIANGFGIRISHIYCIDPVSGPANPIERNTDGIHFNGPIDDVEMSGLTIAANDDGIAFNAGDANLDEKTGGEAIFGGYSTVYGGPITRVSVQGVRYNNCMSAVRLLHGPFLIDQITMGKLTGTVYYHALIANPFGTVPGGGSQTRISIECEIDQTANLDGLAVIGGVTRVFTFKAHRVSGPGTVIAPVSISGSVENLKLELETVDLGADSHEPLVHVTGGTINHLNITGNWKRAVQPPGRQPFVSVTGGLVRKLSLNVNVDNVGCILSHTGGELNGIQTNPSSNGH